MDGRRGFVAELPAGVEPAPGALQPVVRLPSSGPEEDDELDPALKALLSRSKG
jgi:hypothetical protein